MAEKPVDEELELKRKIRRMEEEIADLKRLKDRSGAGWERYLSVLEALPDPIVVHDMEESVVYLNPAFTRVFSWTMDELLGKRLDFVPREDLPETIEAMERVKHGEAILSLETRRWTRDKRLLDIQCGFSAVMDPGGELSGSVVILRDITEEKNELRQSEGKYRSVMEAAPDPITVYDTEGNVTYVNTAFEKIFGWSLDELLGKRLDFVPEEEKEKTQDALKRVFGGENVFLEKVTLSYFKLL